MLTGSGRPGPGREDLGAYTSSVASQPGDRVLVVNGEEGEPASVKDRWLLRSARTW
jgi:NADH:ubiquinone oxidoreductase subunit F (NADH-binding)